MGVDIRTEKIRKMPKSWESWRRSWQYTTKRHVWPWVSDNIFTRAPHQAGMHSLHQTMNQHFFFLAPRLPHVVQGAEGTGSGCEVHDGRGEESSEGVQLSHGARFLRRCTWTLTTSQSRSRSRLSTSLSCKKKSTLRPNRPCIKIIYVPDVILALQNEARFKLLAVRASERCRVRHPDPARWGVFPYFSPKKTSLPASVSFLQNPSKKEVVMQCAPSPPQLCLCWFSTFKSIVFLCITKTKQNALLIEKGKKNSAKSLCRSSSQYIHIYPHEAKIKIFDMHWSPSTAPLLAQRSIFDLQWTL